MADEKDVLLLLGEIKGELKGVNKRLDKVDDIDKRLRVVEKKAAVNGAISGGVISVGIVLVMEGLKAAVKHN